MHYEILDDERLALLPKFAAFRDRFYLAGGTGLALQIGHRDSIDFDFFSEKSFDTATLFSEMEKVFEDHSLTKTQDEKDTLTFLIDDSVSISFLGFPYPLVGPLVAAEHCNLASIIDIGCMKLSAITSRSAMKDYVDLYFILKSVPLARLLAAAHEKFPSLDRNLILKSLVYFDDIATEQIRFVSKHVTSLDEIKKILQRTVRDELRS